MNAQQLSESIVGDMVSDGMAWFGAIFIPLRDYTLLAARITASLAWVFVLYIIAARWSTDFAALLRLGAPSDNTVRTTYSSIAAGSVALAAIVALYGHSLWSQRRERLRAAVERSLEFFYTSGRFGSIAERHASDDEPLSRYYDQLSHAFFALKKSSSPRNIQALRDAYGGISSFDFRLRERMDPLLRENIGTVLVLSEPALDYSFNVRYAWGAITLPLLFSLAGLIFPIGGSYLALSIAGFAIVVATMTCVRLSDARL